MKYHYFIPIILICVLIPLIHLTVQESHKSKIVAYSYSGTIAIQTEDEYVLFKERIAQYNISLNAFQVLNTGYPVLVHFGAEGDGLRFDSPDAPSLFPYGKPKPIKSTLGAFPFYVYGCVVIFALALLATAKGFLATQYQEEKHA